MATKYKENIFNFMGNIVPSMGTVLTKLTLEKLRLWFDHSV